ncbi:MAG: prephenate dehydratase [Actinomycetota bacterium]|nr:prephenate dehydratase [Actinomycetota bacterium]
MAASTPSIPRVAFLGPPGTFTEEALLNEPDLAAGELVPLRSMPEVLAATEAGEVEIGFVALENSIEGTVRLVLDALIFHHDLLIQREVVMSIHQHVLGPPGMSLADVKRVVSFPDALSQCQEFFARELPHVEIVAANSTAEAVQYVGTERPEGTAALGSSLAGKLYGLNVVAPDVEDHAENKTRFVVVANSGIPPRTGHDKTSVVCFQQSDRPGSLQAILGQFAARDINLTKLESRPTKHSLGDYCFIIDMEGHVDDAVVADCLHTLHAMLPQVKFLGSYPAAGEAGAAIRRDADEAWRRADEWLSSLRRQVRRSAGP